MKCRYILNQEDFWLLQNILFTFEGEYGTRLGDAARQMEEHEPDAGRIEPGRLGRFGETLSDVLSSVRLHVRDCGGCREAYRDYVDGQKRGYIFVSRVFRKEGLKTRIDEIDSLDPDFLGLFAH